MTYSRQEFASRLRAQLAEGYDVVRLSRWAFAEYYAHIESLEQGLGEIMMTVGSIEDDPQFEMTEHELLQLADELELGSARRSRR